MLLVLSRQLNRVHLKGRLLYEFNMTAFSECFHRELKIGSSEIHKKLFAIVCSLSYSRILSHLQDKTRAAQYLKGFINFQIN